MELIDLWEEIPKERKKRIVRKVEKILYRFPVYKASLENERISEELPSLVPNYGDGSGGSGGKISRQTEDFVVKKVDRELRVMMIENAILSLTMKERELVDRKYFDPNQPSDYEVYISMGVGSTLYYKIKDQVVQKVAEALNVI